jgi:hypothetical protein
MSILKFFRPNHCHEQVNKEQQRDNPDDGRFHFVLLELLAKAHVESACDEKRNDDPRKNEVAHKSPDNAANSRPASIKLQAK